MAAPVIRSVAASEATVAPGQSFTVWVDAFDPDARTLVFTATTTDAAGAAATATTTVTVGDPLSYALTADDPAVTVVQDPADPARFTVTA